MKRTFYLFILLCLPFLLPAKDKPGYFAIQQGNWFEMQVTQGPENGPYSSAAPIFQFNLRYYLRYHLLRQLPSGAQQYRVEQQRIICFTSEGVDGWLGYDSYYPPYKQGQRVKQPNGAYLLEITANGKIASLSVDKDHPPLPVTLTNYSPRKNINMYTTSSIEPMGVEPLRQIIESMLVARDKTSGLSIRIAADADGCSQLLTAASVPLPGNTWIKGNIGNPGKKEITLSLGDSTWKFQTRPNGDFVYPLTLHAAQTGYITMNNSSSQLFLLPGDTLIIGRDASGAIAFTGSAGFNTQLANNIDRAFYHPDGISPMQTAKSLRDIFDLQQRETAAFNAALDPYTGKALPVCVDYYKTAWQYHLISDQLYFLETHNFQADSALRPFQRIPEQVTDNIDNFPILVNPYPENIFYRDYLNWFLQYQKARIGLAAGGNPEALSFYADYFAILSTLKGFPQYYKLARGINEELRQNSWTSNQRLKPYYQDFIENCGDSNLTAPLIRNWQLMERWAPGNPLPCAKLMLSNGQTYDVKSTAGKVTCLLIDYHGTTRASFYVEQIKSRPDVHFIYAAIRQPAIGGRIDSLISHFPNVTCIELQNKNMDNYRAYGIGHLFQTNFIVLDQWGRIVDDHIPGINKEWSDLQKAIEAAAAAPRFSAATKTNLMNIAGWSLGSILITALAGIGIYRNRIGRIKQAAAMKTAIRELEVKAIRSQMNPHFIFNALNSIQSLINTSRYKEANNYLVKFSLLLRSVLHNAEKNTLPLQDEMSTIRLYCELEQLRFDFSFEIDIAENIAAHLVEIPGMIVQPLVENAIIHGIAAKGKDGFLRIKAGSANGVLQISVYDNGAGFQPAANGQHKSIGLKLVKERLQLFSAQSSNPGLQFTNGNGTTALLTIPIEQV